MRLEKVIKKNNLEKYSEINDNLSYWLSKSFQERILAVEFLRKQLYGNHSMEVHPDFKELLTLFNSYKVDYIIVGAYALAYHGVPRATGDLDIYVRADKQNAQRILDALKEFGFGSMNLNIDDFAQPDQIIQLGVPPVRIDLITSLTGVSWEEAIRGAENGFYGEVPVKYLGKEQLIVNKRTLGRKKDLADLESLGE